jgi:hypothetical protein
LDQDHRAADQRSIGGRKVFQLKGKSEDLDGVMLFNPEGKPLAHTGCRSAAPIFASAARRTTACVPRMRRSMSKQQ